MADSSTCSTCHGPLDAGFAGVCPKCGNPAMASVGLPSTMSLGSSGLTITSVPISAPAINLVAVPSVSAVAPPSLVAAPVAAVPAPEQSVAAPPANPPPVAEIAPPPMEIAMAEVLAAPEPIAAPPPLRPARPPRPSEPDLAWLNAPVVSPKPPSEKVWFMVQNGVQVGPITTRHVCSQAGWDTLVWRSGMGNWLPLKQVPELAARKGSHISDSGLRAEVGQAVPLQAAGLSSRSRAVAVLLALFLGVFGVHNFYLGYGGRGFAQLLITLLTSFWGLVVTLPWALAECYLIATGGITDAQGRKLT